MSANRAEVRRLGGALRMILRLNALAMGTVQSPAGAAEHAHVAGSQHARPTRAPLRTIAVFSRLMSESSHPSDRPMRKLSRAFCLLSAFSSVALADPALTTAASDMRAAPSAKAHVVQRVPARAEIDLSNCSQSWCYASWRNMLGYLPVAAVSAGPVAPIAPDYGYGPPPPPPVVAGPWGVGPFYGYGWYGPLVTSSIARRAPGGPPIKGVDPCAMSLLRFSPPASSPRRAALTPSAA
jgi:hypothetical protein